ncbi:MAG: tRNA (guanosine(37)-N1)-methyltransferase TrmD [Phycisphaerae bacterium]
MRIDVLTLFPELFDAFLETSIIGRAIASGAVEFGFTNYRDFARDNHRSVDDRPFSGGPGMIMMCGPVFDAVEAVTRNCEHAPLKVLLTPQGERLNQGLVSELAGEPRLVLLCGHYEGFDERISIGLQPREISIGDYVLSGGETAAFVVIDAIVRLLPGVLGHEAAAANDSFSEGLLEHPQYTRPRSFRGMEVPEVLLLGNHAEIEAWRRREALERTRRRRPDLLDDSDREDACC